MKILPFAFLIALMPGLAVAQAQNTDIPTALPFAVTIGGQAATYKAGEAFAKLDKPVKSDAAIEVDLNVPMIVINATASSEKGEPVPGAIPATILLQGTNKGTLAGTMDKKPLAAGHYLLTVVAEGRTAAILFTIE